MPRTIGWPRRVDKRAAAGHDLRHAPRRRRRPEGADARPAPAAAAASASPSPRAALLVALLPGPGRGRRHGPRRSTDGAVARRARRRRHHARRRSRPTSRARSCDQPARATAPAACSSSSRPARIRIVARTGTSSPTPFLDISDLVSQAAASRACSGLAFHPSFKTNRKFYVNYTNRAGDTVIREYKASTSQPEPRRTRAPPRTILKIDQPYANHNGGMLAFGPDGYLYIGMGDGGAGGDPGNRAQNIGHAAGQDAPHRRQRHDLDPRHYLHPASEPVRRRSRPQRDLAARPAQPVAVLVRPGDRRPVDRRRRPGRVRGDRPGAPTPRPARARLQLGLARDGGPPLLHPVERLQHVGQGRCRSLEYTHASNGRCAVTGGYVYRGSRDPGARGLVRVRRLLQRRDLGDPGRRVVPAGRGSRSSARAAGATSAASARTRPASCSSSTSTARSTASNRRLTRRQGFPAAARLARMPVMAGYVAMARVERGRVSRARLGRVRARRNPSRPARGDDPLRRRRPIARAGRRPSPSASSGSGSATSCRWSTFYLHRPGELALGPSGGAPNRAASVAAATAARRGSGSPSTSAATWAAEAGPVEIPHGPWPAATNRPLDARDRPTSGRPSSASGRAQARRPRVGAPAIAGT